MRPSELFGFDTPALEQTVKKILSIKISISLYLSSLEVATAKV
jgi:hypothetical protein